MSFQALGEKSEKIWYSRDGHLVGGGHSRLLEAGGGLLEAGGGLLHARGLLEVAGRVLLHVGRLLEACSLLLLK